MLKTPPNLFKKNKRAFTLLELIVVIGVMAILAGILFSATNLNQQSAPLESAQQLLSQAFSNARAQAILKRNRARVLIYAEDPSTDDSPEKFLRYFKIVVETEIGSDEWEITLKGEFLPESTYLIPDRKTININWPDNRPDSYHPTGLVSLKMDDSSTGSALKTWISYTFNSTGRLSGLSNQIVLSTGHLMDNGLEFDKTSAIAGIKFNSYGLEFLVNEEEPL